VRTEFDVAKSEKNKRERALPFHLVADLDWSNAIATIDTRREYDEKRVVALAMLGDRLHVICFVEIDSGIRVISFRKANKREIRRYEQEIANRQSG